VLWLFSIVAFEDQITFFCQARIMPEARSFIRQRGIIEATEFLAGEIPTMTRSLMRRWLLTVLVIILALLPGCAPAPAAEVPVLKLALIPVVDALPIYVAQTQGYFAKHGVQVEFVPVGSAPERDQLIAAGQADGIINEVLSTILYNQDATRLQVVRYAHAATSETHLFSILAAKDSGIQSLADLKGVEIGVSDATLIAYLTERLLALEGFQAADIATVSVPNIRDRMALLSSGELKAAMLPEPLTSVAVGQGARVILDDTSHPEISYSTIAFRKEVIDQQPEAIRAFLAAVEDAVKDINADPSRWQTVLAEQKLVPEALLGKYQPPKFVSAGVPSEEQYADVVTWAEGKGLLRKQVAYSESINPQFLPK
jgi:NitT/TauT family transport system substrate-binding protein